MLLGALVAPLPVLGLVFVTGPAFAGPPQSGSAAAPRVAMHGDVVAGLSHATRTGPVSASLRMSVAISLAPRDSAALKAFVAQVTDPRSPRYKHYLKPAQFAARFGATDASVSQVSSYLRSQGLAVGPVSGNRLVIDASGTAAQMQKAFGVGVSTYQDTKTKRSFYANGAAPTLPAGLASTVVDVAGLSNYTAHTHFDRINTKPRVTPHAVSGLTPTQALTAYDLASENSAGYTGSGVTVALVEFSAYTPSDITAYDNQFGLNASTPTVVKIDGGTTDTSGQDEVELDIEVVQAIAPGATIKVYEAPNTSAGDVDLYAALASANVPVVSISWGSAESATSSSNMTSDDNSFATGAAQGQSFFAASGDSGSDDAGNGGTAVDFPASDPHVTGVGGTTLNLNSDNTYGSETAWSGSGGGTSAQFAQPSFQSSVTSDANRDVPDVSAVADPNTGWAVYTGGAWTTIGGTSAAAPNWAAFAAVYDQYAAAKGGASMGNANSTIYADATGSNYATDFHDVTSGSNGGYSAGTGYDQVTGWGSYDGANFITHNLG
jgi:kumamolisin